MPLDAEAICAHAIAEVSTGITLSRDPAVEGQQPASMRRQDLRVDMEALVWEHMMHKQLYTMETLTRWNASEGGYGRLHLCAGAYPVQTTDHRILTDSSSLFTVASVADPRLLDPRVCDDKT